jgi:hypothetical protein
MCLYYLFIYILYIYIYIWYSEILSCDLHWRSKNILFYSLVVYKLIRS